MTATPYFDSYELRKKITVGSIWVCNKTKNRIQIISISGMYVGFDDGTSWYYTTKARILENFTLLKS